MSFERIAVAISGGGRSLANLLAQQAGKRYRVVGVISSSPNCGGNTIAQLSGLPLSVLNFGKDRPADLDERVSQTLKDLRADGVVLAGFLKFWPCLPDWKHRVINIHPALLPQFGGAGMYGSKVHNAVILKGEKKSGATVHMVDDVYDNGRIISQVEVSVFSSDTADSLADRVFKAECDLLPKTVDRLASGELPLKDEKVWRYEFEPS